MTQSFQLQLNTLSGFISSNSQNLLVSAIIALVTFIVLRVVKRFILNSLKKFEENTFIDAIVLRLHEVGWLTLSITAFYLIISYWPNTPELLSSLSYFAFLAIWSWQAIRLVGQIIDYSARHVIRSSDEDTNESIIRLLANAAKFVIWAIIILLIVSNMGYDINSLIAGLGIGGIAVALAVQTVLGDFISSISIAIDRPFRVGDFIIVDDFKGSVQKIGIKSTRVSSIDGEEIIMPNSELVSSVIRNYGRGRQRRSLHTIGILYETDPRLVKEVPEMIKAILRENEMVENDTFRVNLVEFADFSINYELHFYVKTFNYNEFLDIQQDVLLSIKDKFASEGIEFAYPTQTIHTSKSTNG